MSHHLHNSTTKGLFRRHVFQDRDLSPPNKRALHHNMALFDRSELVLGELLGKGAFCLVHELQDVKLNNGMVKPYFSRPWWDNKLHQADRTRAYVKQACCQEDRLRGEDCNEEDDPCEMDGSGNSEDPASEVVAETKTAETKRRSRYVVKYLRPNLATERSFKVFLHAAADLRMEYEILSRLSHPNIVQLRGGAIIEASSSSGGGMGASRLIPKSIENEDYFLLLERLDETLSQRIHCWKRLEATHPKPHSIDGPATPPFYLEKVRFARDIASALAYIHERRFVFRDLKPDNVGIAADGTMKLFDFGLCRELPKVSKADTAKNGKEPLFCMSGVGTRRYMAPEMIIGRGYNQKIDCYSWAMVFYEMLSLQKPYASYNRDVHKVLVCENEDRPRLSSDIPLETRQLLRRAWTQEPSDRPRMAEIHNHLECIVESVERQALTAHERSLKVIMEMAELFLVEDQYFPHKKDDSFVSRKSTAELTVSTSVSSSFSSNASIMSPSVSMR